LDPRKPIELALFPTKLPIIIFPLPLITPLKLSLAAVIEIV